MTLYEVIWEKGLQPEMVGFCMGLNWVYIIILSTAFYGMTHTKTLDWFINLSSKNWWRSNSIWFAAIITFIFFMIFDGLDGKVNSDYIASGLRSMFFAVIFSSIFIDIPVYIVKGFGKFIDTKTKSPTESK